MAYNEEKRKPSDGRDADNDRVLSRLLAFSDGVFAFAITLLIIGIAVPEGTTKFNLNSALSSLWPNYMAFLISFFVIGLYWINHVRQFRFIRKYDSGLLWLNLLLLLSIVIIPFTTSVLSKYGNRTSVIVYAANVACTGYMVTALWSYAAHNYRLIDKKLGSIFIRRTIMLNLIAPIVFTLSIGIAFIDYNLAEYSWISILVFRTAVSRLYRLPELG